MEYSLSIISRLGVSSIALIVGPHTLEIKSLWGTEYNGLLLEYVLQDQPLGLLDAVHRARDLVDDKFITLLSDEIYIASRHEGMVEYWLAHPEIAGLVGYVVNPNWNDIKKNYAIKMQGQTLESLEEKPRKQINSLLGTGTWALTSEFFDYASFALEHNSPDRRSFVDALQLMIDDNLVLEGYDLQGNYINVNSPGDVERAESLQHSAT